MKRNNSIYRKERRLTLTFKVIARFQVLNEVHFVQRGSQIVITCFSCALFLVTQLTLIDPLRHFNDMQIGGVWQLQTRSCKLEQEMTFLK